MITKIEERVSSQSNTTHIFTKVNIYAHETILKYAKKTTKGTHTPVVQSEMKGVIIIRC
jgi:hypothetical protein